MRKIQVLILISAIIANPFAFANQEEDGPYAIDLHSKNYTVASIIYSGTQGEAIVGVVENTTRNFGVFAECEAPKGSLSSQITKDDLRNCLVRRSSWFEINDNNLQQLNASIPRNMQDEYNRKERDDQPVMLTMFMGAITIGTGFATVGVAKAAISSYRMGAVTGTVGRAFGTVGLIATTAFFGWGVYDMSKRMWQPTPTIESNIVAQYQNLLKSEGKPKTVTFEDINISNLLGDVEILDPNVCLRIAPRLNKEEAI
jgi:hypothetical protein